MTKSLHRLIAALLLLVVVVLQAGFVLAADLYHADSSVKVVAHMGGNEANDPSEKLATLDSQRPMPSVDALLVADCAEHCGGAAILVSCSDMPMIPTRLGRIRPPALSFAAAPPERLERPPKPVLSFA